MKKISLIFIICILTIISSCGNSNGKKKNSSAIVPEDKKEVLDLYTFILMYYDGKESAINSYGYTHTGQVKKSETYIQDFYVKNCLYDTETRLYERISGKSAGICITNLNGTCNFWQFVANSSERDQIFEKLRGMGFQFEYFGDNRYHLQNKFIGIDCELENDMWIYTTTIYRDNDYPFIKPVDVFSFEGRTNNAQKLLNDYRGKRIKITGIVEQIELFSSKYSLYLFRKDDGYSRMDVFIPNEQAFYNINLPARMTISGCLTNASYITLTLNDVYFYSNADEQYVGPNRPTYKTKTAFPRPKIYERRTSSSEVTNKPIFKNKGNNSLTLEQVKVTDQETILSFYKDARIPGTNSYHEWCSIDPNTYIVANGKKYKLTNAEGIAKSPERTKFPIMTMSLNFSLHFPAIPSNTTIIDFYENGESDWFIEGIQLNAP